MKVLLKLEKLYYWKNYIVNFVANIIIYFEVSLKSFCSRKLFIFLYMQRKFLTNLGLLLSLNLLIKPIFIFGIDRNIQNIVGVGDYGFYLVIFNFSFLFNILLDLGITNFNNRNIAQNNHLLNKHFSGIVLLKFVLTLFYVLVTFLIAFILKYNIEQLKLF